MSETQVLPLDGLRVVELAGEIAGPYAAKLLVDAGADVVKLEPPDGGDPLRRWTASGAAIAPGEDGALFQFLNASKRSVCADLDAESGQQMVRELAAGADLVIESLGPGVIERLELSHDVLSRENPALSLVSITPFGRTGPWAERPATEFTLQAAAGSTAYRGLPERGPVAAGGRLGEWCVGSYAAVGALAAWLGARRSGRGQLVDVSMFEAVLSSMTIYHDLMGQLFEGPLPQSIETPSIEPAKDGWVGLCTYTGQQWKDFCALIGRPDLGEDERFYDARARMEHLAFIHEAMHAWTKQQPAAQILETASLMRIPCAPIGNGRNLPEMDHMLERGVFERSAGGFLQPRIPYRLGAGAQRPLGRAPKLGEHGDAVRAELRAAPRARSTGSAAAVSSAGELPFEGLRVIDLTAFWAGPVAVSVLADLGADVIKVESVQRPDGMRFAGAVRNDVMWEWSPVFHGANPGKRDVTLRLDSEEGLALAKRLIETADVLIDNFSARVMGHFGLHWDVVHALNPKLIMLRMPAFGLDGPWRDRTGFAPNVEQVSGLAWITGYPDMPLIVRGACDPVGGMHAVCALVAALEHRRRTGEGQRVEVPLVEPALNIAAEQVIEYSAYGALLTRDTNRGPAAAPQGVYRCADRDGAPDHAAVAVASDAQWEALVGALGRPDWATRPELRSAAGRRAAHDAIDAELAAWFAERDSNEAAEQLSRAGVPAERLVNAHRVMPNPQLIHRGFYQTLEHPFTGKLRYAGHPMRFTQWGAALHRGPPPTLGQHNDEILGGELGLSKAELEHLREAKIIGNRPAG